MTQLQKVAWMNLLILPLMSMMLVLAKYKVLSQAVALSMVALILAGEIVFAFVVAKKPWRKEKVEDERDKQIHQGSFKTAYLALMGCLSAGLVVALLVYPGRQVPLGFINLWVGIGFVASLMGQSIAMLLQYRKGSFAAGDAGGG